MRRKYGSKAICYNVLNPSESGGTVPLKPWKHGGGIASSRNSKIMVLL